MSKQYDSYYLISSKYFLGKDKRNNKATILNIPIKIQIQIFNLLLINSYYDKSGNKHKKIIQSKISRNPGELLIEPAILQICHQIYHEANSILYC